MNKFFLVWFFGFPVNLVYSINPLHHGSNEVNWGLKSTDAPKSLDQNLPTRKVRIAVIDTGVDITHPLLQEKVWTNPGENGTDQSGHWQGNNQIDDDQNGFVDDLHGYSFTSNTNQIEDNHGHGTHVSGIIVQANPHIEIMAVKYCDPRHPPENNLKNSIAALKYAIQMGAEIINYSGGGFGSQPEEREALALASTKGILVVAAAGNDSVNTDKFRYYPASYDLPNILSVTAIDPKTQVLKSSNFGIKNVHIAAPGFEILSALPNGRSGKMTGTSQATAFATAAAAWVISQSLDNPMPNEVISQLRLSGALNKSLYGKTQSSTHLNFTRALKMKAQGVGSSGLRSRNLNSTTDNSIFILSANTTNTDFTEGPKHP